MATGGHDSGDVSPLDEMCDDLPTLYERLFPARAKWRNIGLKLKVEPDTLEAIASKHNNPDDCLREMLTKRLQAVGSLSWREVCNCLRSRTVDRNDVAEKIEEWRKDIVNTTSKIQVPPLLSLPVTGGLNDCLVKQTNQVTSAMTTVGEISLTEDNSREEKCCDLQEKIDCLESQFSYLTRDAGERLKQEHVPIEEFYRKVSSMTLSLKIVAGKYFKETFESVSSFDVLWGHLNQFWDFFNCELFQHVVRVMFTEADDPLLSKLAEYESELKEFLSKTKLSDFVDHWPFSITKPPKTVIRKLKGVLISVHKKWEDCTLYDIKKTRQKFSEEFMLPPEFMVLVGAGNGSVSILLYVPHSLASSIEEQVKQGKEDILADNGFLSITIDGVQVYPLPSMEQASLHGLTMETLKRKTKITEEQLETREEETDLSKLSSIDNTDEDPPRPPPVEEGYLEEEKGGLEASSKLADEVADDQTLNILHPLTFLEWEEWPSLPVEMSNACSVHLNGTLYVGGGSTTGLRADAALYSFKPGVDSTWTVTDTPTYWYTLAVHDSELLLVGGCDHSTRKQTNKVFTMRDGQFVEILPPMNERRYLPSTASNESALVVAGGWVTSGNVSSVEVFKDSQWTTAPSLPITRSRMKSALHGDQWYLIMDQGKVFYVSLQSLISGGDQSPWETLPVTPIHYSAAAFFGGYLLSIAGGNLTTTIHAFSFSTQSWEHVADLPLSPGMPTAVVLSREQLIVSSGARVLQGKLSVTPFDTDSHFTMRAIDRLKASAGIFLIEKLVQNTSPTAFPAVAGVDVQDVYNHILEEWASVRGLHPPTWAELFRVLKEMGLSELAGRMEKHLRGSVPENPPRPPPDDSEEEKDDETPEQEILRLNNVLAEYIGANTLLKKENIQLKKANYNQEQEIAHLKSEKVEEQLDPVSIEKEPTSVKDNQSPSSSLKHTKQETKAEPQTTDGPLHPAITSQPTATIDELVNHVGIDKDLLNQPCSTEHLVKIAPLVPNWQKYAIVLGLNQPQIVSIKSDHLLDPEMKAQQVLSLWKQTNGFKATYSVLVNVCLQKKDVQLAESICNIVKEDSSRPPPITGEKREATEHTEQGPSDKRPRLNTASEDTLELD